MTNRKINYLYLYELIYFKISLDIKADTPFQFKIVFLMQRFIIEFQFNASITVTYNTQLRGIIKIFYKVI